MHWLRLVSIFLLVVGALMLIGGLIWYHQNTGKFAEGAIALVLGGLLLLMGAIIMLIVSFQFETPDPVQQVQEDLRTGQITGAAQTNIIRR